MGKAKKKRIVLCGTNFGQIYLKAISLLSEELELVGIVSRGSEQSKKCAQMYNVPLLSSVDLLDKTKVDLVCIAIKSSVTGGNGTKIAIDCLKKGISVVQEQPVHFNDMFNCYKIALKNNCHYTVNGFYPSIRACRTFIEYSNKLLSMTKPIGINAECSMQVVYPLVDIIGKALGGLTSWNIKNISESTKSVFTTLEGEVMNIPLNLCVENRIVPSNPDNYLLLFHSISLFTECGELRLDSSNGLVLWKPRFFISRSENKVLNFDDENDFSIMKTTEILNQEDLTIDYKTLYQEVWPEGVALELKKFLYEIDSSINRSKMQYQINICKMWQDIGSELGPATILKEENFKSFSMQSL